MTRAPKRIDLHCHSDASNQTGEALLNALRCPESYSRPEQVYRQAIRRGMDFVTLTDHDSIDGALAIAHRPDVIVGEELTCWFPEDHCKMHVLVFGLSREDHDRLHSLSGSIYDVAEYLEQQNLAHAVAHPIYRQNDKLERWHLERLILLFKGFECLNGAHSALHREAFEPLLDKLTPQQIARLCETHHLAARWPQPWIKARTGGSDDHGLLNVGRTWTEVAGDVTTTSQLLECLRQGRCKPGGEAGSSAKLAHTFYSVAMRYYTRHVMPPQARPNLATMLLQTIAGQRPAPGRLEMAMLGLRHRLRKIVRRIVSPFAREPEPMAGTALLKRLFLRSAWKHLDEHPDLRAAADAGLPPLGEHDPMLGLVSQINRDITDGLAAAVQHCIDDASFTGMFDTIGALLAQQFVLLPYYFTVFHQNKERHLLRRITQQHELKTAQTLRVGLFTDTFDEINGVARFLHDMIAQAQKLGRQFTIHTCTKDPRIEIPGLARRNFAPLFSHPLPYYKQLSLNVPPLLDVLLWADQQQFDAVHVSTPGPMGLCGWIVSKMLRVPMLATYHTDFPAYVERLANDHRITNGTIAYMRWFYRQAAAVFTRSSAYRFNLRDLGVPDQAMRAIPPGIDLGKFNPAHRDAGLWAEQRISEPRRLFYCGRVSVEKNLPMLADAFKSLCRKRRDAALVIAGDGPYLQTMQHELRGLPAYVLGFQSDQQLARLYASADIFVFPSRTDTLGQVVIEAQASGLPAIVSNEGGPKETVEHGITGLVLASDDPAAWCRAIEELLDDEARRQRMSQAAARSSGRFSLTRTFESFWADHLAAIEPPHRDSEAIAPTPQTPAPL